MTIGVLTTSFPRFRGDFAGGFVEDAVRHLALSGAAIEVIAAADAMVAADVVDTRPDLGPSVSVRRVAAGPGGSGLPLFYGPGAPEALEQGGLGGWVQAFGFWAGLCQVIRARAPGWQRVEAHWLVPCALAAQACAPQLPLRAHAHSGDVALLERMPGGAALARQLARGGTEMIFASSNLRDRFARLVDVSGAGLPGDGWGGGRVAESAERDQVHARSDLERTLARQVLGMDGRTVLSVGRLVPIKGFDVLLRAVAVASARTRVPATVVILGDGPERARLEGLARRLKVTLRLPGFVPRDEVARWMAGADLYVQPSRRLPSGRTEGLPVATLEALALGVPVVASATGGLTELPHAPPHLHLVPPDDHLALAVRLAS